MHLFNLELYCQNVRGLNTEVDTFYPNAIANDFDVIALTETWLNEDVFSSDYFSPNYNVHRFNKLGRGRGMANCEHKNLAIDACVPTGDGVRNGKVGFTIVSEQKTKHCYGTGPSEKAGTEVSEEEEGSREV